MLIDAHNHANWHGHSAAKLVANMDEHGIDVAWLLTWEAPAAEYGGLDAAAFDPRRTCLALDDVLAACEKFPGRFVPGYAPDPRDPRSQGRLRAAVQMHGIRVYGELKLRMCLDNPDAVDMFHLCGELGLPVTFHIDLPHYPGETERKRHLWYCHGIEALERVLAEVPETTFIGHAPGFWRHISGDADRQGVTYPKGPVTPGGILPRLLREHDNLCADLSAGSALGAISRDPAFGRKFLIEFQDRLLFARDYFDARLMNFLKSLKLPKRAFEKIACKNALRLVPLATQPARKGKAPAKRRRAKQSAP